MESPITIKSQIAKRSKGIRESEIPAFAIATVAAALFSACTTEQVSRNVYEGIRVHNESLESTPMEKMKGRTMSYDEYEKERQRNAAGGK
jgi:hypothetical protein